MIKTPLRVLLIEDDEDDYLLVRDYLDETNDAMLSLEWAATYETGRAALSRREHDIALVDYRLGAQSGLDLLRAADGTSDLPPMIILTGAGDPAVDAAAQTAGAFDFLVKGQLDASTLERAIRYTLDQSRQRAALTEAQRFLQATLDALSAHIAVLDEQGVVVAANAAWRCFALQNDFLDGGYGLGLDYLAVCDAGARDGADGAAEVAAAIRDILAGQRTTFVREDPCHGPHERRWFAMHISRFPGDGPVRAVVAHENVTERHLAAEQNRFQAQLLDQVPVAVIATDPAGVVTHWNAHATALYGWTSEETLGQPIEALTVRPADAESARALLERVTAGEVWAGEFPVRRKDGTSFPAYVTDSAIHDARGRFAGVVGVSVDISARKRIEEALQASERNYRKLLEQAADAIFIFGLDGHFLTVNAQACALTGYAHAELLALAVVDIMPPGEASAIPARVADLADGPRTRERLVRRKDGVLVPSEVSAAQLDDGRVQIIIRDITERQAAEAALRASEARYRMLLEQASDGIVVMDPSARFVEVNAQACIMLGYAREELLALGSPDVIAPADLATRPLVFPQPGPTPTVFERRLRRRDGTTFPVEASIKRLPDGGTQAILRDITARVAADEALRQGAESFASLFEATGDGIIITQEGRVVAINRAYTTLMGYEPDDLIGRSVLDIVVPDERALIGARIAANHDQSYEIRQLRKDGSAFLAEVIGRSFRYHGRPARLSTVRDITARKRTADALHADAARRQALIETQHAVAAAQLDHDTLMEVVIGHAQSLTNADGAMLELLEGEELVCRAACGGATALVGLRLAIGQSLSGRCVQTGEAQHCDDAEQDERADRSVWEQGKIRSMLVVPLRYEGRTFGVLKVLARGQAAFGAGDLETLELLAGVGGAALSHAAAYEEQRALAAALRANEASLAEAQRIAHVGSWEYDHKTDTIQWSDEFFRIAGFAPRSFQPTMRRGLALIHPEDRAFVSARFRETAATNVTNEIEFRFLRPDRSVRFVQQRTESLFDATGRPARRLGVVHDVTEQRSLEQQLRHQAFHDALTGLPNRALLFEHIGRALGRARRGGLPCAVLFLDLDRFKDVNDTVGHDAGDRLLQAVAARLGQTLHDGDTLARLGGDEFTLLLENVADPSAAACAAIRLLDSLTSPLVVDGQDYRLTASVGIALGRPDHQRPEEVLRDADIAMYRAKDGGRAGYAIFDPAMQAQIVARLELERDLRHALDRQEFQLYYQPIVDLRTGDVAKVEALVRWQHPTRGLVSPGTFIPLAEETGLIRPLGRWVLGEACRQARAWQMAGTPLPIAVNLTALEFQHPDLAEQVAAALAEAGTEAHWLSLEITESLAMRDVAATIDTLRALRALGVATAIDDFGTGYSSLAYLKRLPVSALKVDKAFIDGLGTDDEDTAIVSTIITLGHTLGLRVIAEGVETAAQAGLLRALGCDQAQGYHFARPLPAAALEELLADAAIREARPGQGTHPQPTAGALRPRRAAPQQLLPGGRGVASD